MTDAEATISIQVDAKTFNTASYLSGAQIKALVQKDVQYQLFIENGGKKPDELIRDDQSVKLKEGMCFYTVPPAAFGR